jgi:hypothetical protein
LAQGYDIKRFLETLAAERSKYPFLKKTDYGF